MLLRHFYIMQIPDSSLVMGIPAKVVKQISEQQAQMLKLGALHYVEMAERHERGDFPLM